MRSPTPTHRVPRTVARAGAAALALGAFACVTPGAVSGTRDQRPQPGVLELDSMVVTPAGARGAPQRLGDSPVYFEFQVERPVTLLASGVGPRLPDSLRTARVEGQVLAQFVVDTNGLAQVATFKVLRSTHPLFVEAVRGSLADMRFAPARVGGRPVRQLVQQPFQFALSP